MPHSIIKKVWDYCSYSKKYLAFIFILLYISSIIQNYVQAYGDSLALIILNIIVVVSVSGYGMTITRDRINHGVRLPKIMVKDVIVLGIKSSIVTFIYWEAQTYILRFVCFKLNFPIYNLEEMLLRWYDTLHMLYAHNPLDTVLFVIVGSIVFYVTTFFIEIAIAKLADSGNILSSFNFLSIKRSIDIVGWRNYAKDYTMIILAITFMSFLISIEIPNTFIDSLVDMILSFLIFATEYLGIGAVYCKIKDLEEMKTPITVN